MGRLSFGQPLSVYHSTLLTIYQIRIAFGSYGDPVLVRTVKNTLTDTTLFYGGGIKDREKTEEMAQLADVIIIGNLIYEDLKMALETVSIAQKYK